ncbi:MAG: hypothetical protein ACUVTR_01930 [Dehalococcoidia bacterium]
MTGSGTMADPYLIRDINDLQNMKLNLAAYYELANDIDASATSGWNGGLGFDPIDGFLGSLDGKGHAIMGLYINRPTESAGLFGQDFSGSAILKNTKLVNATIIGSALNGGFICHTGGSPVIENCSFHGCVYATTSTGEIGGIIGCAYGNVSISKCSVAGTIGNAMYGYASSVGGLVGENHANLTIFKSYTTCSVLGDYYVGGLVGLSASGILTIDQCYTTGNIIGGRWGVGGLIGDSSHPSDLITNSYARGDVSGYEAVGGAFGSFYDGSFGNVYSTGKVTGTLNVGGLHGYDGGTEEISPCFWDIETSRQPASISGTGKTTAEMKVIDTFLAAGWDIDSAVHGRNDGYPCLGWEVGSPRTWLGGGWTAGIGRKRSVPLGLVIGKGGFVHARR